ncbi:MAG: hypothetical protein JWP10_558 [Nocardioidaceae bacterium]|nr:hypothetical protein [Nocardioidaceae bacterium]
MHRDRGQQHRRQRQHPRVLRDRERSDARSHRVLHPERHDPDQDHRDRGREPCSDRRQRTAWASSPGWGAACRDEQAPPERHLHVRLADAAPQRHQDAEGAAYLAWTRTGCCPDARWARADPDEDHQGAGHRRPEGPLRQAQVQRPREPQARPRLRVQRQPPAQRPVWAQDQDGDPVSDRCLRAQARVPRSACRRRPRRW